MEADELRDGDEFWLLFRALPSDVPAGVRLRGLLRHALRTRPAQMAAVGEAQDAAAGPAVVNAGAGSPGPGVDRFNQ